MSRDADPKVDPKTVRLYDKRIVDRNIKKGLLSRKDYDKHLKALDDIADKGVYGGPLEGDDDDVLDGVALEADGADEEDLDDEGDETPPSAPEGNNHSS